MQNSFLNNKIILKYCKDYYRIINEEYSESDFMTDKVINIFQTYIFSIDVNKKDEIKKASNLNNAVARYIDDREFKTLLNKYLMGLKVSKNVEDVVGYIAGCIIKEYEKYMEGFTRNLYIPRWV